MTNPRHADTDSIDHLTTARGLLAYPRTPDDYLGAIAHALVAIAERLPAPGETVAEDERIAAWEAIAEHPVFAPCYDTAAPLLLSMLDRLDGLAAQPPAVVLPTVGEVAEAILASATTGEGWHASGARAALDLITARVTPWQPVEPGTVIKAGMRYRIESVDGESTEGTCHLDLTTHEDGWFIDPRTVPAERLDAQPRVTTPERAEKRREEAERSRCARCGGLNGNHGLVHTASHANVHSVPCPERTGR